MSDTPSGPPVWLISFTDVIALMLTFFVLLYAMSNPEPEKWDKKIGTTHHNKAQFSGAKNQAGSDEGINLNRLSFAEAENLKYLEILFEETMEDNTMSVKQSNGRLFLFFNTNHIKKNKDNLYIFFKKITPLLKSLDNKITLTTTPLKSNHFMSMQQLGTELRNNGYHRPLTIEIAENILGNRDGFAITVHPHNGRRITR